MKILYILNQNGKMIRNHETDTRKKCIGGEGGGYCKEAQYPFTDTIKNF